MPSSQAHSSTSASKATNGMPRKANSGRTGDVWGSSSVASVPPMISRIGTAISATMVETGGGKADSPGAAGTWSWATCAAISSVMAKPRGRLSLSR